MSKNKMHNRIKQAKSENSRPTIGVLLSHLTHKNDISMWQGVVDAARQRDVNVICYVGLWLDSPYGFEAHANVIYDLVSAEKLDGLVIMAGAITQFVQLEGKRAFIERFAPLPIVTLESEVAGTPNIYVDSRQNMWKVVLHLIQTHSYRRIAFIRGPETHRGANERYQAYVEILAECGLPFDPSLVTPPLNWYHGRQGLSWLLEQQVDFDAVIGANDNLAIGAIEELRARGVRIPEDVAVAGYDDAAQSRWITPPLTTVPIETYTWGKKALEMVLALIEGQPVPEQVVIPTELIVRRSCGCTDPTVGQAIVEPDLAMPQDTSNQILTDQQETILAAVQQAVEKENLSLESGQVAQFVGVFVTGLSYTAKGTFSQKLDQIFHQTIETGGDIEEWHQVVSALRRQALAYLSDHKTRLRAENLWQQARLMIGKTAYHMQGYQEFLAEQRKDILREIGSELITTFDIEGLMDVLARQFPRLDILNAYVALYENPQQPSGLARLLLAYNKQERIKVEAEEDVFPASQLIPQNLWSRGQHYSMVTLPLYFQTQQIGFITFEANPQDGPIYEALREQLSSALKGALLVEQVQFQASQLDTAIAETVATVQEMRTTAAGTAERARMMADAAQQSIDVSRAGQEAVADSITGMETVLHQTEATVQQIKDLAGQTGQIGEIIEAVKDFAEQSKMLALNARIEAARAGESGRTFAIVAQEMRNLALQSRAATTRVSEILMAIQEATGTAVDVSQEGSRGAEQGMALVGRAGEAINALASTMEQASQASMEIAAITHQQTNGMDRLLTAIHSIKQSSTEVREGFSRGG